jgi:hypothetical protein
MTDQPTPADFKTLERYRALVLRIAKLRIENPTVLMHLDNYAQAVEHICEGIEHQKLQGKV